LAGMVKASEGTQDRGLPVQPVAYDS